MNCSASFPGPRGDRNGFDESPVPPPERPPQLRTVLLIALFAWLVLGMVSVVVAFVAQWWRSS